MARKRKVKAPPEPLPKDFLDQIAPAVVKFNTDHYILGSAYHCTLAVRGYPTTTEELALLSHLGEHSGVTLVIRRSSRTPPTAAVWSAAVPTT